MKETANKKILTRQNHWRLYVENLFYRSIPPMARKNGEDCSLTSWNGLEEE